MLAKWSLFSVYVHSLLIRASFTMSSKSAVPLVNTRATKPICLETGFLLPAFLTFSFSCAIENGFKLILILLSVTLKLFHRACWAFQSGALSCSIGCTQLFDRVHSVVRSGALSCTIGCTQSLNRVHSVAQSGALSCNFHAAKKRVRRWPHGTGAWPVAVLSSLSFLQCI